MMQIRIMGHAGVMVGIHVSTPPALSRLWAPKGGGMPCGDTVFAGGCVA